MKARFFCDSCGAAVAARADRCPACGKVFAAVRCPQCGYEGRPSEFLRGCKVCGYLAEEDRGNTAPARRRQTTISRGTARLLVAGLGLVLVVLVALLLAILDRG
jgi:hypothetical protein